jgi:hypothetical protein
VQEPGYNAIHFNQVAHSWVRDVRIINSDSAFYSWGMTFCTITGGCLRFPYACSVPAAVVALLLLSSPPHHLLQSRKLDKRAARLGQPRPGDLPLHDLLEDMDRIMSSAAAAAFSTAIVITIHDTVGTLDDWKDQENARF